jgi:hypothetical protein
MGQLQNNSMGEVKGRVGKIVGSTWKGINYIKSSPRSSNRKPTAAQQEHRDRFKLMANFLQQIRPLVNITFGSASRMTGFNKAVEANLTYDRL